MKNIYKISILLFCALFINQNCKAQNYPKKGDHFYDNNIDKFVGTWLWKDENKSFKVIFKKEHAHFTMIDMYSDVIIGFHQFIKDGIKIEDSSNFSTTLFNDNNWTILANSDKSNAKILDGGIQHVSKNKSVKFIIEYIDSNHIKLVSVKNREGIKISTPENPYDSTISLPENIILTRQQ